MSTTCLIPSCAFPLLQCPSSGRARLARIQTTRACRGSVAGCASRLFTMWQGITGVYIIIIIISSSISAPTHTHTHSSICMQLREKACLLLAHLQHTALGVSLLVPNFGSKFITDHVLHRCLPPHVCPPCFASPAQRGCINGLKWGDSPAAFSCFCL
jgi:hypothetical protein